MVHIIFPQKASEEHFTVEIDYAAIRKELLAIRKTGRALTDVEKGFNKLCITFLKKVVAPQLKDTFMLNISNDGEISQSLKCSPRVVKRVRERLSSVGVLFVPSWARQKKMGDYPVWMFSFKFSTQSDVVVEHEPLWKPLPRNSKYCGCYQFLYEESKRAVWEMLEEDGTEVIHVSDLMKFVWSQFGWELDRRGRTREEFLKTNDFHQCSENGGAPTSALVVMPELPAALGVRDEPVDPERFEALRVLLSNIKP